MKITIGWNGDKVEVPEKLSLWQIIDSQPEIKDYVYGFGNETLTDKQWQDCKDYNSFVVFVNGSYKDENNRPYGIREIPEHGDHIEIWGNGAWVNGCKSSRCFGGPEEGGWWYSEIDCLYAIRCQTFATAEDMMETMKEKFPDLDWCIDSEPESWHSPRFTPHYE